MEDPKSLGDLFEKKLFRIPDYQRGYAWQRSQLKDFWEDLVNLSESRSHYTGVLTLKEIPRRSVDPAEKEYWLIEDHGYKLFHIVDGQQRLTTFVIFLQAFIEHLRKLPTNKGRRDEDIYVTDSLHLANLQDQYLYKVKPTGDQFRTYKFGYTKDNPSYEYLRYRILAEAGSGSVEETFYTLNLSNALKYFNQQLRQLYDNEGTTGLQQIYKKLTRKFLFNEYVIKEEFDVFVAFETMNNRGKKLSDLELLKNRLIYLTTLYEESELDEASRANLRERVNDAWKEIYHQLGRYKSRPLNDDDFLWAHWVMYFKYSRQTGGDYINFLLNEQFTPKRILRMAERDVALDTPQEVRSEAHLEGVADDEDAEQDDKAIESWPHLAPVEIADYVTSLKESVVHWFNSFHPNLATEMPESERLWIERLNRVGMIYFRPLVMAILKSSGAATARIRVFESIERFIFIVFRTTTARANYASSVFYNMARSLDRSEIDLMAISDRLQERMYYIFDSDGTMQIDEFRTVLAKKFSQGTGYYGWTGLRYFLFEYETKLMSESRQSKVDWSDLLNSPNDRISIEHIYPQTETAEWAHCFTIVPQTDKINYSGTLGNLLLLSMSINSSLQNDSFDEKKNAKFNPSGEKRRNGYNDGSHSEIEVSLNATWGPEQIKARGVKLLQFMEDRWRFKFKSEEDLEKLLFVNTPDPAP